MSILGLIRHGSTIWNKEGRSQGHSNIPLDQDGIIQAKILAEQLSKEEWDEIYSSDLLRARQTAEIIAEKRGITNIKYDERLREMKRGKVEGTTEEDRIRLWGNHWKEIDLGLELPEEGANRGAQCIDEISIRDRNKSILIISDGELLRNSLKRLIPNLSTEELLKNTSITKIKKINKIWECVVYNCTVHLDNNQAIKTD